MGRPREQRWQSFLAALVWLLLFVVDAKAQSVRVVSMGVGGWFRPGTPTGLLVEARADVEQAAEAELSWELRGPDGDRLDVTRRVIVEPGQSVRAWLYGTPLADTAAEFTESTVRLWALRDGVRTGELARTRFSPDALLPPARAASVEVDLALVVGGSTMGLEQFDFDPRAGASPSSLNAPMRMASVDSASALPDRAIGLRAFSLVAWGDPDPQSIPPAQAEALLGWVSRGGHLSIVATGADDTWGIGPGPNRRASHPLRAILPSGGFPAERLEGVPVQSIVLALSKSTMLRNTNATTAMWLFDGEALAPPWRPLAALPTHRYPNTSLPKVEPDSPDGLIWAVRREWGTGLVSVLGIDADELARRALQTGGLPQASSFWGPIIGRRGDALTRAEYASLGKAEPAVLASSSGADLDLLGGTVRSAIDIGSDAVSAILVAFVLFAAYWALAVPVSYYALRAKGWVQHAWLVYVAVAAVFCVLAWGASMIAGATGRGARHLSVVDSVLAANLASGGAPGQRTARGWVGVPLQGYGRAVFSLDHADSGDTLLPFSEPYAITTGFPDTQVIPISSTRAVALDVPSRATVTLLEYEAVGAASSEWDDPIRLAGIEPVSCEVFSGQTIRAQVHGSIVHGLPGAMEDVYVVLAAPVRTPVTTMEGTPPRPVPTGAAPLRGTMRYVGSWDPGVPLDLNRTFGTAMLYAATSDRNDLADEINRSWCTPLRSRSVFSIDASTLTSNQRLAAMSLFGLLTPPTYLKPSQDAELGATTRLVRPMGHWMDLSGHAAGGAILVIGAVRGSLPVDLRLDGEPVASTGTTIVRSIIPLGSNGSWLAPTIPDQATVSWR